MEQEEEKKDTAEYVNPAILEAFDGDIDEWMSWNKQAEEFKEQTVSDSEEDDGIERQLTADGKAVEWFNVRAEETISEETDMQQPHISEPVEIPIDQPMKQEPADNGLRAETTKLIREEEYRSYEGKPAFLSEDDNGLKIHPIDVTDPHYANYVPDPYYEYGIGPEPKQPRGRVGAASGMSIASMICGIASIMLIFCGYGFPLSIVALVLGIISVSRKTNSTGGKVMSVVGISCASLSLLGMCIWVVYLIADF